MKNIKAILTVVLLCSTLAQCLNQDDKSYLKSLAKGYTTLGLGLLLPGMLGAVKITTNDKVIRFSNPIRFVAETSLRAGAIVLSPVISAAATVSLPVLAPLVYQGSKKVVNSGRHESFQNPLVRHYGPTMITNSLLLRAPVPALAGFGVPLAYKKYQEAKKA